MLTRGDLILFIVYFEEIAEKYGTEIKFINATEGGAYINGFEHIPLKRALEQYTDGDIDKKLPINCLKPDNRELKHYARNLLAEEGKCRAQIRFALNDLPGEYSICAEDVATGTSAVQKIVLEQ